MACITVTGYPSSGKSTFVEYLSTNLKTRIEEAGSSQQVIVLTDDAVGVTKGSYAESASEKPARGLLLSAVFRSLSPRSIVIIDSLNYIKGWRYQIFCAANEAGVRRATVQLATPASKCTEFNTLRPLTSRWDPTVLDQLIMRYEPPTNQQRWDAPLFTVAFDDDDKAKSATVDGVWEAITTGIIKARGQAVTPVQAPQESSLQLLTSTTSLVIQSISTHIQNSPGDLHCRLPIPPFESGEVLQLPMKSISVAELNRLKRQFEKLQLKAITTGAVGGDGVLKGQKEIAGAFIRYLGGVWGTNE